MFDDSEREQIAEFAALLTDDEWQNRPVVGTEDDIFDSVDGNATTRVVNDACVFLNDRSFDGGHGCALHIGAVNRGERAMDWKPTVCWQVPFRLEEYEDGAGTRTVVVRSWRRSDWGDGGADFGWFCTDEFEPGTADAVTWLNHLDELTALVGEWPVQALANHLRPGVPVDLVSKSQKRPLPH